jgi:hypothetical protein
VDFRKEIVRVMTWGELGGKGDLVRSFKRKE